MFKATILAAAAACACVGHAGEIQLGAIRLGMTRQDLARAFPKGVAGGIAIAGASSRRGPDAPAVLFREDRLERFAAYFAAADFDRLRRAVVAKDASLQCRSNTNVSVCYDLVGNFVLTRSGDTTMLLMQTPRAAADAERALGELDAAASDGRSGM